MRIIRSAVILPSMLLTLLSGHAMAEQIKCPTFIETTTAEPILKSVPAGWEATTRQTRLRLDGATLTIGRPEKLADLKPEPYQFNNKTYDWQLSKQDFTDHGVWFSCSYNQEQVLLTQQVKGPATACRLISSQSKQTHTKQITLECE